MNNLEVIIGKFGLIMFIIILHQGVDEFSFTFKVIVSLALLVYMWGPFYDEVNKEGKDDAKL